MVANSEVKRMARACSVIELMLWGIIENTQDKFHVYWSHMNFPPSKRKKKMTISCEQKNKTKKIFNFTFVLYGRSNLRTGLSTVIHRLETTLTHVDTHSDTHTHTLTQNEMRAVRGPVMESNGDISRQPTSAPGRSPWQPQHRPLREIIVSCCLTATSCTNTHTHSLPNWQNKNLT